jgi:multidrug resistance efflux pump
MNSSASSDRKMAQAFAGVVAHLSMNSGTAESLFKSLHQSGNFTLAAEIRAQIDAMRAMEALLTQAATPTDGNEDAWVIH